MQTQWDTFSSFVHKVDVDTVSHGTIEEFNLSFFGFMKALEAAKCQASRLVFHAQGSLPFLIITLLLDCFRSKGFVITYDIHDLHEKSREKGVYRTIRYSFFRYYLLLFAEYIVCKHKAVSTITVSKGLANLVSDRYRCRAPRIVYNLGVTEFVDADNFHQRHQNFVYFANLAFAFCVIKL